MGHIFISYSHKDKTYAHKLQRKLLEQGFEAWIDDRIDYGAHWPDEIEKRLNECEAFILIMSPTAKASEWVQNELNLARKLKKPIFPLLLDGEEWWHIGTTQFVNATGGKLPDTKFFVRLAEVSSRKWADGRGSGDLHSTQKESLPQNVSIHISGDVTGNIVVGTENKVEASAQVRKMEDREKQERETREREAAEKAAREQAEREVAEKAALKQAELEAAEKSAREQAEREALEKDIRQKLERETAEKVAREKAEREAARAAARMREQAARAAILEPDTSPRQPEMAISGPTPQHSSPAPKKPEKAWYQRTEVIVTVIGLFATICAALIGAMPWKDWFPASPAPTATLVPVLTPTTLVMPSATFAPTETPAPTLNPTEAFTPTATSLPIEITQKGAKMALVPAGTFTMGSDKGLDDEKPPHQVTLDAFYMDVYEVYNYLYKACVEAGDCTPPHDTKSYTHSDYYGNSQYDNYPVIYVDWEQAKIYCEWRGVRLPTEAEWEYAARGSEGRTYPWGEGIDKTFANYNQYVGDTTDVGKYEKGKSPFGMYDMAGNVWEWVADWYDAYPGNTVSNSDYGAKYRVLRGGSWGNDDSGGRSAFRGRYFPTSTNFYFGFRCARSP
jgi:formylglycine-generating enzyme required for sulfatase activity